MLEIFDIQKLLEQRLNRLGNEELFKVYYWAKNYDKNYLESGNGFFITGQDEPIAFPERKEYILSRIVDFNGSYEPIPNYSIINLSFEIDFYFPTEKTEDIKSRINNLARSLTGKEFNLNGTNIVFKTEIPTYVDSTIQHLRELGGYDDRFEFEETKEYTIAAIRIYATASESLLLGNDIYYKIKALNGNVLQEIHPLTNECGNTLETDSEQEFGKATTGSIAKTNESIFTFSFYQNVNYFSDLLLKRIYYGQNQDSVYLLTPVINNYEQEDIKVIITDVSFEGGLGKPVIFEIALKRSDE